MLRRVITRAGLFFLMVSFCISQDFWTKKNEAKANPGLILTTPLIAIETLEMCAAAVTVAAAVGIIGATQKNTIQRAIDGMITQIRSSTTEQFESMKRSIAEFIESIQALAHGLPSPATCPINSPIARNPDRDRAHQNATPATRSTTQTNRCQDPATCCKEFIDGIQKKPGVTIEKIRSQSYKIHYRDPATGRRLECCFEWDRMHGDAFEIFHDNGTHGGEKGCDDMDTNPCEYTRGRGTHGMPDPTGRHRARAGCPELRRSSKDLEDFLK